MIISQNVGLANAMRVSLSCYNLLERENLSNVDSGLLEVDYIVVDSSILTKSSLQLKRILATRQYAERKLIVVIDTKYLDSESVGLLHYNFDHLFFYQEGEEVISGLIDCLEGFKPELNQLDSLYFDNNATIYEKTVQSSIDKGIILDEIESHLDEKSINPRLANNIRVVLDEFFMNALYNAPREQGQPKYAHLPRNSNIELLEHEYFTIKLLCDEGKFGVCVTDQFGSLLPESFRHHLYLGFNNIVRLRVEEGFGAGMGLYMSYKLLSRFSVSITQGEKTTMMGIIEPKFSVKKHKQKSKSINIFFKKCG